MKLAVVGSRVGIDPDFVSSVLTRHLEKNRIDCIITGGSRGVDTFAEKWAAGRIDVKVYHADWNSHGKAAGAIRNQRMVDDCDEIFIFWDGESPGTKITLEMAMKAKKIITLYVMPKLE